MAELDIEKLKSCPNCHKKIEKQSIDQIVDNIMELDEGTKIQILAPVVRGDDAG